MPTVLPSAYTEELLAKFMARELGPHVTAALDWHDEGMINGEDLGEYEEPIAETLLLLDVDDLSGFTSNYERLALRRIARWQAWMHARQALSADVDEIEGSVSYARSQLYQMALKNERLAASHASPYVAIGSAPVVVHVVPPSTWTPTDEESEAEFGA